MVDYDVVEFVYEEAEVSPNEEFIGETSEPFIGVYFNLGQRITSTWGDKTISLKPLYYSFGYFPRMPNRSLVLGEQYRSLGVHMNPNCFVAEEWSCYPFLKDFFCRYESGTSESCFTPPLKMSKQMIGGIMRLRKSKFRGNFADDFYLSLAFELIYWALDEVVQRISFKEEGCVINARPDFNELRALVRKNLSMKFTNRTLGVLAAMEEDSFIKLFKDQFRMTPLQFVHEERMKKASALLKVSSQMSVEEAFGRVGLEHPRFFNNLSISNFLKPLD